LISFIKWYPVDAAKTANAAAANKQVSEMIFRMVPPVQVVEQRTRYLKTAEMRIKSGLIIIYLKAPPPESNR